MRAMAGKAFSALTDRRMLVAASGLLYGPEPGVTERTVCVGARFDG
jgi:hypothetical protein